MNAPRRIKRLLRRRMRRQVQRAAGKPISATAMLKAPYRRIAR